MATNGAYRAVHALALEQHGILTAAQAREAGVTPAALTKMLHRGVLVALAHGLYRDLAAPETRLTPYVTAILWPRGTTGVLSHETALALMELSDANPATIHVTVPKSHRPRRRTPPPGVMLHFADLPPEDIGSVEGLPVTSAARTIRDCAATHLGPALLRQAIADARRTGWLTPTDADAVTAALRLADAL